MAAATPTESRPPSIPSARLSIKKHALAAPPDHPLLLDDDLQNDPLITRAAELMSSTALTPSQSLFSNHSLPNHRAAAASPLFDDEDDEDDDDDEDDHADAAHQQQLHTLPQNGSLRRPDLHRHQFNQPVPLQPLDPIHQSEAKLNTHLLNLQSHSQSEHRNQSEQPHNPHLASEHHHHHHHHHHQKSEGHSQLVAPTTQFARALPTRATAAMASNPNRSNPVQTQAPAPQSSHAAFIFSDAWYDQMCLEAIPLRFRVPPDVMQPSFFRVMCAQHNSLFPPEPSPPSVVTHSAEANVLYQSLSFLHEGLNQVFDVYDDLVELDGVHATDAPMVQLRSTWKHLRGTTEMLQCRYDLLCGYRNRDFRQTALMEAQMTPALGHSALAAAVNDDMRGVPTEASQGGADTREKFYDNEFSWKSGERNNEQQTASEDVAQSVAPKSNGKSLSPRKKRNRRVTWADRQSPSCEFVFVLRRYDLIGASVIRGAWQVFGGFLWRLIILPHKEKGLEGNLWVHLQCGGSCDEGESDEDEEGVHYDHEEHEEHEEGEEEEDEEEEEGEEEGGTEKQYEDDEHSVEDENEDEDEDEERDDHDVHGQVEWCRPTQFVMRIVHSTSPLARAAVRSGREMFDSVETVEQSQWFNESDEPSLYPDIKRQEYHVFRSTSDDWGFEIAKFSTLQPGLYADDDMNVVFAVRISLLSFEQPLPRLESR